MEGVWKVHVRCLEGGWKVSCWPLLVGVWRISEVYMEGVWNMCQTCLEFVWKVSGRCLRGPDWIGFAPFGPGRYLVVSRFFGV